MIEEYENLKELKIFHNGLNKEAYVFDKNNEPVKGIVSLDMSFNSNTILFDVKIRFSIIQANRNPEYEYDKKGNLVYKTDSVDIPGCIVQMFDSRVSNESFSEALKIWDKTNQFSKPTLKDIENVIKESSG
jgi:hypothetical protein